MTTFQLILMGLFLLNVIGNFYDSGAYAHGKKVVKEGTGYAIMCLIAGIVNTILAIGILFSW